MGLRRAEILKKMGAFVDFSELGDFIDQPIRVYSSGMLARLGFSAMANLDPEILLIDEALAVGDIEFQNKRVGKNGKFLIKWSYHGFRFAYDDNRRNDM